MPFPLVAAGIAVLAAAVLTGCGDDSKKNSEDNSDGGTAGTTGTAGPEGTAATGGGTPSSGTGGSGGTAGTAGTAGSAGTMDAGTTDASTSDASDDDGGTEGGSSTAEPYIFGFRYGTEPNVSRWQGKGNLLFSDMDSCLLTGGEFEASLVGAGDAAPKTTVSIDMSGMSSIDMCVSQVELSLSGGIFEGVIWILDRHVGPRDRFQIISCDTMADADAPLEDCQGGLSLDTP